jgi:hypothetical protein
MLGADKFFPSAVIAKLICFNADGSFWPCPSQAWPDDALQENKTSYSLQFAYKYFKLLALSQFVSGNWGLRIA